MTATTRAPAYGRDLLVSETNPTSTITYWRTGSTVDGRTPALKVITAYRPLSRRYVAAVGEVTLELRDSGRFTERASTAPETTATRRARRSGFDPIDLATFTADETGRALARVALR